MFFLLSVRVITAQSKISELCVFVHQYLFPDAALDKSDLSDVKSTLHSPGGTTEPDRESEDYVSLPAATDSAAVETQSAALCSSDVFPVNSISIIS